jgi:hypothetical protein
VPDETEDARHQEAYEKAQQILLKELHELMADRPEHRSYLDALMAVDKADIYDVPLEGVSAQAADAIQTDVLWLKTPYRPGFPFSSGPERAYQRRRSIDARAARRRQDTVGSLSYLLRVPGLDEEKKPQ